jgi:hypothetical protein
MRELKFKLDSVSQDKAQKNFWIAPFHYALKGKEKKSKEQKRKSVKGY